MARNSRMVINLEPFVKEALHHAAKHDRRSLSAMAEKAIVEHLEHHGYLERLKPIQAVARDGFIVSVDRRTGKPV